MQRQTLSDATLSLGLIALRTRRYTCFAIRMTFHESFGRTALRWPSCNTASPCVVRRHLVWTVGSVTCLWIVVLEHDMLDDLVTRQASHISDHLKRLILTSIHGKKGQRFLLFIKRCNRFDEWHVVRLRARVGRRSDLEIEHNPSTKIRSMQEWIVRSFASRPSRHSRS